MQDDANLFNADIAYPTSMNNEKTLAISVAFEFWTDFEGNLLAHRDKV